MGTTAWRRALVAAIAISLGMSLVAPGAAMALTPLDPSKFFIHITRSYDAALVPGGDFTLSVGRYGPAGPIHFAEVIGDTLVDLGSAPWRDAGAVNGDPHYVASIEVPGPTAGVHTYRAIVDATDTLDGLTIDISRDFQPAPMSITISTSSTTVQAHTTVYLGTVLTGPATGTQLGGTVEWRDADTGSILATQAASAALLILESLPVGVHRFSATYSGDPQRTPATSTVLELTVVPDLVEVSGVGVQYATFYPVRDGYRDTLAIRGKRLEAASVAISITGPTGKVVRSARILSGTGSYSYAWNGRNAAGSLLPAGKYRIVQAIADAWSTRTVTSFATVSHRRLVMHTATITKAGSAVASRGRTGSGSVSVSSSGYVRLRSGSGTAWAGWEFTIPRATVYSRITFAVYAQTYDAVPWNGMGLQDFTECPRTTKKWRVACMGAWRSIGTQTGSKAWFRRSVTSSAYRSGRYVRGVVIGQFYLTYVYKARITVVYGTLQ